MGVILILILIACCKVVFVETREGSWEKPDEQKLLFFSNWKASWELPGKTMLASLFINTSNTGMLQFMPHH